MSERGPRLLVVTGGSSGIGLATARQAAGQGATVISLDLVAPPAGEPVGHLLCDVRREDAVAEAADRVRARHGHADALFVASGVLGPAADVARLPGEAWSDVLDTNLTGSFHAVKHFAGDLRATRGAIVLTASIVAGKGSPSHPAYAAAKGGVVALGRSLAVALAPDGVRVNVICPGSTVGTNLLGRPVSPPELLGLAASIPAGRPATPADIARSVAFLLSGAAAHVTGAVLTVDGGERYGRAAPQREEAGGVRADAR